MHDEQGRGVDDAQLAQEFRDYLDRTEQYADTAELTPAQRCRALDITEDDYRDAFSLSLVKVRRILHLIRREDRERKSQHRREQRISAGQSVATLPVWATGQPEQLSEGSWVLMAA